MKESLQKKGNLFIQNRDVLRDTFKMESTYIYPVCANIFSGKGKLVSKDTLLNCKKTVNAETSVLSNFRGMVKLPTMCLLATSGQPEEKMAKANAIYQKLKNEFMGSTYLALVAMILTDMVSEEEAEQYITRGHVIYKKMRAEHPFLTSSEDSVFAVLLAFADKSDDQLMEELETAFDALKKANVGGSNAIQSLSHVLALTEGNVKEKYSRVLAIRDGLSKKGKKYGKYYELAVLGALAILDADVDSLVEDVIAVDDFLASQKGYGFFGVDKKTRLMHAAMIVASDYSENEDEYGNRKTGSETIAAMASTLAMIAAQQAAMCAVVAASASSAASH